MNTKLFIPEKVKVGYQERTDTYTKKLAYVIYYDEKGVLRKEKSWQSWRDDKIEPLDIDNKPHSGFTLNKGILRDGYWGGGHNMVRIYDDRGIEFEITVSNLMYILMGNDCNKRVLSGEFVYAWNGTELVLLPTNTEEYKISTTFTELKTNKVSMKEVKENVGCLFKTKNLENWVYLGKLEMNFSKWKSGKYTKSRESQHIYYNVDKDVYFSEPSASRLAYLIDPVKVDNFEELLENYFKSKHYIQVDELIIDVGEDITEYFTQVRKHEYFSKDSVSYFIDTHNRFYNGRYASSVSLYTNLIGVLSSNWDTKHLYLTPIHNESNTSNWNRNRIEEQKDLNYNNGYTEYNIVNNGLRFNRVSIKVRIKNGEIISIKDDLHSYKFEQNFKITINRY